MGDTELLKEDTLGKIEFKPFKHIERNKWAKNLLAEKYEKYKKSNIEENNVAVEHNDAKAAKAAKAAQAAQAVQAAHNALMADAQRKRIAAENRQAAISQEPPPGYQKLQEELYEKYYREEKSKIEFTADTDENVNKFRVASDKALEMASSEATRILM